MTPERDAQIVAALEVVDSLDAFQEVHVTLQDPRKCKAALQAFKLVRQNAELLEALVRLSRQVGPKAGIPVVEEAARLGFVTGVLVGAQAALDAAGNMKAAA